MPALEAPLLARATLLARDRCPSGYYERHGYCYNSWYWWGRWVLVGILILCTILTLILLARRNSRRRRLNGQRPMYGTAWMAPPPYQPPPQYSAAAPVYPQNTGHKFNANEGYYGPQQNHNGYNGSSSYQPQQEGIQLQQPAQAYTRSGPDEDYAPPPGPPPAKTAN